MTGLELRTGLHGIARHPRARPAPVPTLTLPDHRRPILILGRAGDCDVVLADPTVSRVHAVLMRYGGQWLLLDRGSTNGTTVNGRRTWGTIAVRPGDLVTFGRLGFRLARAPKGQV
ncbi:hypothetical protein DDE18_01070 [Nocardioides gansuensis]|uniref:FHA domain-containing protein n=1 Tax=Nocardioides gansuensis TaxID=2138300 RepID=A0A2T8FEY3_9ACTN|nr:FHA domain-containing protein [Nocardioides gansuensis]PVG84255.1 hypothetical protein DDE18_01070 [Nocardioides gansuensis]